MSTLSEELRLPSHCEVLCVPSQGNFVCLASSESYIYPLKGVAFTAQRLPWYHLLSGIRLSTLTGKLRLSIHSGELRLLLHGNCACLLSQGNGM